MFLDFESLLQDVCHCEIGGRDVGFWNPDLETWNYHGVVWHQNMKFLDQNMELLVF